MQELAGSATMLFWEDGPLGVLTTDQLLASRRGANQREERILVEKRAALRKPFDIRPCHGCTLDDWSWTRSRSAGSTGSRRLQADDDRERRRR